MGGNVGTKVGVIDGEIVGRKEGNSVGISVGVTVGRKEGISVGTFEGWKLGSNVGSKLGSKLGTKLGKVLGLSLLAHSHVGQSSDSKLEMVWSLKARVIASSARSFNSLDVIVADFEGGAVAGNCTYGYETPCLMHNNFCRQHINKFIKK